MNVFHRLSTQLLLLAVIPVGLLAMLVAYYSVDTRQHQIDHFISERSKQLSRQFEIIIAHSPDKKALLQALATSSIEEQGLHALSVLDQQKTFLAQAGPNLAKQQLKQTLPQQAKHWKDAQYSHFLLPIFTAPDNAVKPAIDKNSATAWLLVSYDNNYYQRLFYAQELGMAMLILIVLILACLAAWFISKRMQQDFNRVCDYAKRFVKTKRVEHLKINSCFEAATMLETIEQTATSLSQELDNMRHNVALTTSDLKETIETIEIQNIELNIAKKSATKASEIKSQFLANTSHEIRTPLNGIIGFTKLLENTPLNHEQKDYLLTIQQSSDGLLAIINDILDFSKIEAGKLSLEKQPFKLQQVLDESMALFAPSAYEKGLDIALMVYQDVPQYLLGDALRIKQILHNLLSNAVKFTHEGHIEIRASLEAENEQSCQISFEITDTGIGLSQAQQLSLFESFFQANNAMTRQYGGTGLGLSISRNLIALMHGNIGVDSTIGKGTSFYFTLKLDKNPTPLLQAQPKAQLHGKTVIVCETHTLSALSTKHLLLQLGAQTVLLIEQLEDVQQEAFQNADILLTSTNLCLSDADNITLLKRAKTLFAGDVFALIPLCTRTEAIKQAINNMPFCSKPLSIEKLSACLSNKEPATSPRAKQSLLNSKPIKTYPWHILVCDDHPANLKLLRILLEDLGLTVSQAENGQQAIELSQKQPFDLIFMDIQMPTISGIDACHHIRKTAGPNQNTAIVALTANALNKEKQDALEHGFNRYLTKPIDTQKIEQCLFDFCHRKTVSENIFNPELALKRVNNKEDIAIEMLQGLLTELQTVVATLPSCEQQQKLYHVHKIHGACAYTGAQALQKACAAYEYALNNQEGCQPALANFIETAEQLLQALANKDLPALFSAEKTAADT